MEGGDAIVDSLGRGLVHEVTENGDGSLIVQGDDSHSYSVEQRLLRYSEKQMLGTTKDRGVFRQLGNALLLWLFQLTATLWTCSSVHWLPPLGVVLNGTILPGSCHISASLVILPSAVVILS